LGVILQLLKFFNLPQLLFFCQLQVDELNGLSSKSFSVAGFIEHLGFLKPQPYCCGLRNPKVLVLQTGTALSFSFPAVMLFTRFLWENIGESPAN